MKMASAPGSNHRMNDDKLTQCLILLLKEQQIQKQAVQKFTEALGNLREDMTVEFRRLYKAIDSINRNMASSKQCDIAIGSNQPVGGARHKKVRRPPVQPSSEDSDENTDPNVNRRRREKPTNKRGVDSFSPSRSHRTMRVPVGSPVPLGSVPPGNVPKPVAKSNGARNMKAVNYNMQKEPLRTKPLIRAQPQESDFIDLMKSLNLEVNRATVAAVTSVAKEFSANSLATRPAALNTIVIIDTSESMKGAPFQAAKSFLNTMLDDIDTSAAEFGLEEYISVITCGEAVGIAQPFTNDFIQIRRTVEKLRVGGRTPLMTSLVLALCYLEQQSECVKVVDHMIMPRLIVVSDFEATLDKQPFSGRDQDISEDRIKVQRELFSLGLTFKKQKYSVVCVPVAKGNVAVAKEFAGKCNGDVVKLNDAQEIGCYYRYQMLIGRAFADRDAGDRNAQDVDIYTTVKNSLASGGLNKGHEAGLNKLLEKILNQIDDIDSEDEFVLNDVKYKNGKPSKDFVVLAEAKARPTEERASPVHTGRSSSSHSGNVSMGSPANVPDIPELPEWKPTRNLDTIDFGEQGGLPSIGSRVRRGKDWKWNDDDGNGPGTIVGHRQKGIGYVLWDNGKVGAYRHGYEGQFDIQKTKDPRHVEPGGIEVGCSVIRGADWDRGDEDGGVGTVGVVVRKLRDRFVKVRWPSRVIETYCFGAEEKWDLEVTLGEAPTRGTNTPVPENGTSGHGTEGQSSSQQAAEAESLLPWWSWQDKHKQWRSFSETAVQKMELKYNANSNHCAVEYKNKQVKLYLMSNECEIDGHKYPIKREMLKEEDIESLKMLEDYQQPID